MFSKKINSNKNWKSQACKCRWQLSPHEYGFDLTKMHQQQAKSKILFCLQFAFYIRGQLSVCDVAYAVPHRRHCIYQKSDNNGCTPVDRYYTAKLFACPCKGRCRLWIVVLYVPVHTSRNTNCGKKM